MDRIQSNTIQLAVDVDGKTYSQGVYLANKAINDLMGITETVIPYVQDPKVIEAFAKLKAKKKKRDLERLIAKDNKRKKPKKKKG